MKQNKTEKLTKEMKVWLLKTLQLGTISTETVKEFFNMCEVVQVELTPGERDQRIAYLKSKLLNE